MIEVLNVTKTFDSFTALDGLSLHVPAGSVYGLVGPNGAGKSTAIRCICGIYKPERGSVNVGGAPIFENPEAKQKLAYIPDEIYFFPQCSIDDMAKFYQSVYPAFDTTRFEKLSEIFQLPRKQLIRRMSRGMQKQYAFWINLCLHPQVLLLDEPVDGLDPVMRRQIWSLLMSDVAEHGTTVLLSSHNLRELEDVCDHVGILNRGKMLIERSLDSLQDNIVKLQVAFNESMPDLPPELDVLKISSSGRIYTIIARGGAEKVTALMQPLSPAILDILPLSLEEIFIYELGGADYAVKELFI